jgi:FkbM family methyltransferase
LVFSLLSRRLTEWATCELLLLENYPRWTLILPVYFLSYVVDSSIPLFKPLGSIMRRIRAIISRSFGLRVLTIRPFESLRLCSDLDSIYLIASEYMKGETVQLLSARDQVVLDLGAHYGLVSTKIAAVSPSSDVIAIEAHPSNYQVLKRNVELNHLTNVRAYNFAVASYTGSATMMVHDGISTHYSLARRYAGSEFASRVLCYRLSDMLALLHLDRVDLVKMDIEGLELEVLQSSFPALAGRIGKLDIEVHQPQDLPRVSNLLRSNGYAVEAKRAGILSGSYRVLAKRE